MPTPQSTFFRPQSLSKEGLCKINLRGSSLYDYANENTVWSLTGPLAFPSVSDGGSWKYFIPRALGLNEPTSLTRDSLVSTSITNFTIMFRFFTGANAAPGASGTSLFFNGTPMAGGFWGTYIFGGDANTLQFLFIYALRGTPTTETIASNYIQANTWYHVAVTIMDNNRGDNTHTFSGYLNGLKTGVNLTFPDMDILSGNTTIGDVGMGQTQPFQITDLVFLEKVLNENEIKAYANSAYI